MCGGKTIVFITSLDMSGKSFKALSENSLEFSEDFSLTSYFYSVRMVDPSQEDIFVMKDKMEIVYNHVKGDLTEYARNQNYFSNTLLLSG